MSIWRKRPHREIDVVLTSSGSRAPVFIGALEALEELGYRIKRISGASGGALVAAGYALGFSIPKMKELALSTPYSSFKDFKVRNLLNYKNPSIYTGTALDRFYQEIFGDATLKDFQIDCKIVVVTIAENKRIILSRESHPDLPVWKAVRMSSTIPFIFPYYSLDGVPVTDGGLDTGAPYLFENRERPILILRPRSNIFRIAPKEASKSPILLWNYIKIVGEYIVNTLDLRIMEPTPGAEVIVIPTFNIGGFDFSLTEKDVKNLISYGYQAVIAWEYAVDPRISD